MPFVLLTAHPEFGDRAILGANHRWATQLVRAGVAEEVQLRRSYGRGSGAIEGLSPNHSALVQGYRRAIEQAGPGGTLGILVGHGSGGLTSHGARTTPMVDLGPSETCRVTIDLPREASSGRAAIRHLRSLIGDRGGTAPPSGLANANLVLWHVSRIVAIGALRDIYLLSCSIGAFGGPELIRHLRALWGGTVQVYGLEGYLTSVDSDGDSRIEMRVTRGAPELDPLDGGPSLLNFDAEDSSALDRFEQRMIDRSQFVRAADSATWVSWP